MMRLPLSTVYIACKSQEEGPLSGARQSRSRDTWREQALVKTGGGPRHQVYPGTGAGHRSHSSQEKAGM